MEQRAETHDRLITTTEAADILGVSRGTVITWATAGRFPAIRYGTAGQSIRYRFAREDILGFRKRTLARAHTVKWPTGDTIARTELKRQPDRGE